LWVICEFLRENILTGFGWVNLGYSQYLNLSLIQIVDIFGVKFISFLIVMVNVLIWESILFLDKKQKNKTDIKTILVKVFFVIIILSSCFLYSDYKFKHRALENKSSSIKISLVQPNVPQELKWDPQVSGQIVDKLRYLGQRADKETLVIFPEAAWPFTIDLENMSLLREFIKDIEQDILLGAAVKEKEKFYNSALLLDREGKVSFFYKKIKLVPFGEYVPLRKFIDFIDVINLIGDMTPGETVTKFLYKEKSFSVLICFEDIFPLHVRRFASESDFLINITNDAWFKGEPEASQHLGIMVFRAVENNISIIRSANTGISGWVSSFGKIEKLTKGQKDINFLGVGTFSVLLEKNRSFYNKHGDILILFCFFILLLIYAKGGKLCRLS